MSTAFPESSRQFLAGREVTHIPLTLQHIIEPYYASFTPLGRALPTWIYGGILACVPTLNPSTLFSVKQPRSYFLDPR